MPNYNHVVLMGHLTRDPELSYTPSETAVTKVGMAVSRKYKETEETSFFDLTFFGKIAEVVSQYTKKGDLLFVEGRMKQDRWEKDGQKHSKVYVIGENIQLMSKKQTGQGQNEEVDEGDIPF